MKDVDRALLDIAERNHQIVDLGDVARSGMTARQWQRRVRSGFWLPVQPTVWRHAAVPETFEVRVHAIARSLGREAALAGAAAAAWWGLDGFDRSIEPVTFIVPRRREWRVTSEVRTTRDWRTADLLRRDDIRITSVTRVILDLAEFGETARRIEGAIDSGIRLRLTALATILRRMADPGRRFHTGMPLLRELLLDAGGESVLERRFLRLMRDSDLPRPRTQVRHTRDSGRALRVDFEFPGGLVVEVSGRLGHTSDRDRQIDARRRNALQQAGKVALEFTTADVIEDPGYVAATVRRSLRAQMEGARRPKGSL